MANIREVHSATSGDTAPLPVAMLRYRTRISEMFADVRGADVLKLAGPMQARVHRAQPPNIFVQARARVHAHGEVHRRNMHVQEHSESLCTRCTLPRNVMRKFLTNSEP